MAKQVNDTKLLEALLVNGNVSSAAAALNISQSAIYQRLRDPELRQQYDALQGVILTAAAASMTAGLEEAVAALIDIIKDKDLNPNVRVSAANSLLTHCNRYIETSSILRRLDDLERISNKNKENKIYV